MSQKKQMKIYLIPLSIVVVVVLVVAAALWLNQSKSTTQTAKPFGHQALKINGNFVSDEIFSQEQNKFFQRYENNSEMLRKSDEERTDLILEEVIKRFVVEDYLQKANIPVTASEIDNYVNRYIKTKFSTPDEMQEYLASSGYKDEADMKKDIGFYLQRLKCFSGIAKENGVSVTEDEVEKEYQKQQTECVKMVARRILLSVKNHSAQEAKELGDQIYDRLKKGEDFAALAKQYSDDEENKDNGGLMTPFARGMNIPQFDEPVFKGKPGDLLPPFSTDMGVNIVAIDKLIEYYHTKDEIRDTLLMQKFGESDKFNSWLAKIETGMKIEVTDPAMNAFRLFKGGKYNEAGQKYEEVYGASSWEFDLQRAAESYEKAGNWDNALRVNETGMQKYSQQVTYYLGAAEALYRKQQVDEAMNLMKKTEDMSANNIVYNGYVADMYSKLGLEKDAIRIKQRNIDIKWTPGPTEAPLSTN